MDGSRKWQSGKRKSDDTCMHDCELDAKMARPEINVHFNSIKVALFLVRMIFPRQPPLFPEIISKSLRICLSRADEKKRI